MNKLKVVSSAKEDNAYTTAVSDALGFQLHMQAWFYKTVLRETMLKEGYENLVETGDLIFFNKGTEQPITKLEPMKFYG